MEEIELVKMFCERNGINQHNLEIKPCPVPYAALRYGWQIETFDPEQSTKRETIHFTAWRYNSVHRLLGYRASTHTVYIAHSI